MPSLSIASPTKLKEYFILTLLTGFCLISFSYHLGEVPPYHTDENFYVFSAKKMLQTGDYLTPEFNQKKRFAKPILFYWQVALSYKVFGISLASARLWSVLLGTLSAVLVYFLGRRLFSPQAALLSAFILPSIYLHFQISRWATTDMTLSFFILCAFFFFIRGFQEETHRTLNYILFYIAMALGFLAKGPPAILLPALTIAAFLFIRGDWNRIAEMKPVAGLLILLAIDVPWFAAMYLLHGEEFANHLLGAEVRDRIFHQTPFSFYYPGVIVRYFLPWSLFLLFGLVASSRHFKSRVLNFFDKGNYAPLFCFLWILIPLIFFTALRIEHSRYLLPASAAMALILGHYFTVLANSEPGFKRPSFKIPFYLALLFFFLMTLATAAGVLIFPSTTSVPFRIMFLPLFLAAGPTIMILMFITRRKITLIFTLAVFQTGSLALIHGDAIPFFNRYPMKKFAAEIANTGSGQETIGVFQLGSHQARIGILTGQRARFLFLPEGVREFAGQDEKYYLVMKETEWKDKFEDLNLTLQATDQIWKTRRLDEKFIRGLWNKRLPPDLSDHLETIVLLTNR